jgi:hypothetical protein
LRGTQLGLAYYALATPEPASKIIATVAVVVIVAVDVGIEWVHGIISGEERTATQQILDKIDRDERYHAVRRFLTNDMKEISR